MLTKFNLLMQMTTDPDDRASAQQHSGGWSEGFWLQGLYTPTATGIRSIAEKRARLLPAQAAIIGVRIGYYNIDGNKVLPSGSATGRLNFPGRSTLKTDLPQVALLMKGTTAASANTSSFFLRCMPDDIMKGGEYQPTTSFRNAVSQYCDEIANSANLGFIGRDLTRPTARVLGIVGNVVTLSADIGAAQNSFLRFIRTRDDGGKPIKGTYRILTVTNPTNLVVENLNATMTRANGLARIDAIAFYDFNAVGPKRAVTRKVGRPFEAYRGRQSKRTRT
jgi:hypothetical protein